MLVLPFKMMANKLFCVTANIHLPKFRIPEEVKLSQYLSKTYFLIYIKFCEAPLWSITLTVYLNTPKWQISKDAPTTSLTISGGDLEHLIEVETNVF